MLRTLAASAAVALVSIPVGAATTSSASDHELPEARLRIAGKSREASVWSGIWAAREGPYCSIEHRDGVPTVRGRFRLARGSHRARILFWKSQRPRRVRVEIYKRLDRNGNPRGKPRKVDPRLKPKRVDGETVGWRAIFRVRLKGPRYILAVARWPDADGCGENQEIDLVFPGIKPRR